MICRFCGDTFILRHGKPGRINVCETPACQRADTKQAPEPAKLGGNMVWHHKTAPELEIKPMAQAKAFAKATRRFGTGVTACLVASKLDPTGREAHKQGTGTEDRAQYYSKLGEKRTVKQ